MPRLFVLGLGYPQSQVSVEYSHFCPCRLLLLQGLSAVRLASLSIAQTVFRWVLSVTLRICSFFSLGSHSIHFDAFLRQRILEAMRPQFSK